MLKFLYAREKANSFYPEPWNWSEDPFPAFRGAGQRYKAFLAVAGGFKPWFSSLNLADNTAMSDNYCKIIMTKKGSRLLVPCSKREDEKILLITARGGFRGSFGKIEAIGAEILWQEGMSMHCCPVAHIIARITSPDGYIRTETGRRSCYGETEIFSWRGGYFSMSTEEYEAAVETGVLFAAHDTIQSDLMKCRAKRCEQAESREMRKKLSAQLEAINARIEACGSRDTYTLGETFFTEKDWGGTIISHLYTLEEVEKAEHKALKFEADHALERAMTEWKPRFKAVVSNFASKGKTQVYQNCVILEGYGRFEYSAEDFERFEKLALRIEEDTQEELRKKAAEEAEKARIAKAKAEAAARKAAAEAEAKELGLPSDIRLWHRSGTTNAGKAWVLSPSGMERDCDYVDTSVCGSNNKRYHQSYEGDHVWNQILPGELVLYWSHAYTAAPHHFEVIYRPETITEAQLECVAEIQEELETRFFGATGLTGTRSCPSIGQGWGLYHRNESVTVTSETTATQEEVEKESSDFTVTLGERFGSVFAKIGQ